MVWYNFVHWFGLFSLLFIGLIYYLIGTGKGFKDSKIRKPSISGWGGSSLEVSYFSFKHLGFNQNTGLVIIAFLLFALINVIIVFVSKNQPIHNTKWYRSFFKYIPRMGIWLYVIILIVNQVLVF